MIPESDSLFNGSIALRLMVLLTVIRPIVTDSCFH